MLIDANAYVGHWPFRKLGGNTLEGLDATARETGITHMCVANLHGVFYKDAMQANRELSELAGVYRGETVMLPFAIINPAYPAWREDMKRCVEELGFKGVELCPVYHGYQLREQGAEAVERAGELGVPVRILAEFENYRQQHRLDVFREPDTEDLTELLRMTRRTALILNGFAPTMQQTLVSAAAARENTYFDICRLDSFVIHSFEDMVGKIGAGRLCFGTLSPFYSVEPNLIKLRFACTEPGQVDAIAYQNLRKHLQS